MVRASTEWKEGSVQNQKPQCFYSRCWHPQDWVSSYHLPATGRCLSLLSVASHDSENCLSLSAAHPVVHEVGVAPAGQHVRTCTQTPSSWGAITPPTGFPVLGVGQRINPSLLLPLTFNKESPQSCSLPFIGQGQQCWEGQGRSGRPALITKNPCSETRPPV